jgi:hypothetical protein
MVKFFIISFHRHLKLTMLHFCRCEAFVFLVIYILPFSIFSTRYAKLLYRFWPNCSNIARLLYHPLSGVQSSLIVAWHLHWHDLVFSDGGFPWINKTSIKYIFLHIHFKKGKRKHACSIEDICHQITEHPHTISCLDFVFSALRRLFPYLSPKPCSHDYRL